LQRLEPVLNASTGNLVRISRFPLGMQSGWTIDREYSDGDDVQVDSDRNVVGPSGSPTLHLVALRVSNSMLPPFRPRSFAQHVVSLYVRGQWKGKLVVIGGRAETLAEKPIQVEDNHWQRIEVPFKPLLGVMTHGLRLEGRDNYGSTLASRARRQSHALFSSDAVGGHLAFPASEASPARIQFSDEPAQLRYSVTGQALVPC